MTRQQISKSSRQMSSTTLRLGQLPSGLARMRNPPLEVQLWGRIPPGPWVSIVGTRKASEIGKKNAFGLARELASAGVTVLSGGALGIDSAAHAGAMAGGGSTLIVAPVWWEAAYPKENTALFQEILKNGGGYLSLAALSDKPLTPAFYRRNEALMALSTVVVLGECPLRSGAKNAMNYARNLGRPRYVLPFPYNQASAWGSCQEVVKFGAELLGSAAPIFRRLEAEGPFDNPRYCRWLEEKVLIDSASEPQDMNVSEPSLQEIVLKRDESIQEPEGRRVLAAIAGGQVTTDAICGATGISPALVQHQILLLTLAGYVREDSRGVLCIC